MQLTYMTICINTERLHNSLENIGYLQTAKNDNSTATVLRHYQHILKSRNRQSSNAVHSLIFNLFFKIPFIPTYKLDSVGHDSANDSIINVLSIELGLLEPDTWQLQTLTNGKAEGFRWTVLGGPHRQYDVGRECLNNQLCGTLRGVWGKWDSQVHPLEEHRMERKQELLLVSCKVKEDKSKKPTPNLRWKSSPGWERPFWTDSYRAQAEKTVLNCYWVLADHSVILPQHRWQLQGTTVLKEQEMLTVLGPKMQRGQRCLTKD